MKKVTPKGLELTFHLTSCVDNYYLNEIQQLIEDNLKIITHRDIINATGVTCCGHNRTLTVILKIDPEELLWLMLDNTDESSRFAYTYMAINVLLILNNTD